MSIIISGSGVRTGNSTTKVLEFGTEGTLTLNGDLATTGSAGFTAITATGLASLDGGINVNDSLTVSNAGAVAGATSIDASGLSSLDGGINVRDVFTAATNGAVVAASLNNSSGGITNAGSIAGATTINASGVVTAGGLTVGSAVLNEADLEQLDDLTAGTVAASKAVVVDSDKDASGFRNVTGTGAITAGTSFIIGSADLNEADMEKLDGITNGTAAAAKALVLDSNKDIGTIRNLTSNGSVSSVYLTASHAYIQNLDVGVINSKTTTVENVEVSASLMILSSGSATANEADGSGLFLSGANAFFGWNNTMSALSSSHQMFVNGNMELGSGASLVIGSADLNEADLEKLDGITNGAGAANKALVLDGSADVASGLRNLSATGVITGGSLNDGTATYDAGVISSGVSATFSGVVTAGGLTVGNAVLNEADLEQLDDLTAGTATASKALVVDSNKDIGTLRHVTSNGTLTGASASFGAGGFTTVAASAAITAGTSFVIGSADLNEADMEKLDGITDGTAAANKAMVLDGNADITGGRNLTISGELDAATLDIESGADIKGTCNLDTVQIDGATTFGANDTGVDVKMFGATAGSYMLWDEDQNTLKLNAAPLSGTTVCVMGAAPSSGVAIATPETWAVKAGQFITYSDATLKKNVKQLDGAIEKVMSMRGVSYEMKSDTKGRAEVGFIAQEMKQLVPEVVYGDGDGNYGIDYGKITSVLVEAVKAQQAQIDELKALLKK